MSYPGRSGHGYGNQRHGSGRRGGRGFSKRDTMLAKSAFSGRSEQSQRADLARQAPIAPSLEVWLHSPASWDIPGVDAKLSTNPLHLQKQALEMSQAANKRKLELEVRQPNSKKPLRKFKIIKKEEAEKLKEQEEKAKAEGKELAKAEVTPIIENSSHKLPSEQEILEKAQQMYMHDNGRMDYQESVGTNLPERNELAEEGYLQKAKLALMTSQNTVASRQTFDYVEGIKNELEKIGFTVVPVEGFSVEDLRY